MSESHNGVVLQGNEDDRLIVLKPIEKKLSNSIGRTGLPVELAVAIEEGNYVVNVCNGGLSDGYHTEL